ncbi:c-type cytochrome biogenesis protein CcmI/CycH [Endozoicomonadaceae bacterium StTr2]
MRLIAFLFTVLFSLTTVAADGKQIEVRVQLAESLLASMDPSWPVYVYASHPGNKIPLSSAQLTVDDLPDTILLTEDMYILPNLTLAGADRVRVTAKISSSGDPHKTSKLDKVGKTEAFDLSEGQQVKTTVLINQSALRN